MKVVVHDLDSTFDELIQSKCDCIVPADGRYAPCQGCFRCWTKHPAECFMKGKLRQVCRVLGQADELVIVTRNLYGGYSAAVKNVLDRSIGASLAVQHRAQRSEYGGLVSFGHLGQLWAKCPASAVSQP